MNVRPKCIMNTGRGERRNGITLLNVLLAIFLILLLVALFLPARRSAGPAAYRATCSNQLKNIALALHNYASAYDAFPPAYTVDDNGQRLHSWRTLVLPYMDQSGLYKQIDLSKPWDDPVNASAMQQRNVWYVCPSAEVQENHTTYLAIVTPSSWIQSKRMRPYADITKHQANKLMVIEVDAKHAVPWMSPWDADEKLVLDMGPDSQLSHEGGMNAALVDGRVRFLSADMPDYERRTLITIEASQAKK